MNPPADRLDLRPVDPAYRASFADGSSLHVHSDAAAMAAEVGRFAGRAEGRRLPAAAGLADPSPTRLEFDGFIAANFDLAAGPADPALGPAGRDRRVPPLGTDGAALHPRRTAAAGLLVSRPSTSGCRRARALAAYAVIAYMDTVAGVYFPRGGMRALPGALAAAAADCRRRIPLRRQRSPGWSAPAVG